jgi:hypothetical protein
VAVVGGMTLLVGRRMNLVTGIQVKGEEFLGEATDMEIGVLRTREITGNILFLLNIIPIFNLTTKV